MFDIYFFIYRGFEFDDSWLDGEEEFYYMEIEVNVDNVIQKFFEMCMLFLLEVVGLLFFFILVLDYDYQKKVFKILN